MPNYIWAFLIALIVALVATPGVIVLAGKTGAMDAPDARKVHKGPMPRIGGLAIYVGFMAAMAAMLNFGDLPQVKSFTSETGFYTREGIRRSLWR